MLSAKNIQSGKIHFDELRLLSKEDFEIENRRTKISAGDVLLTIVGAIGRTAVVPEKHPEFTLQRSVAVLKPELIDSNYLRYLLDSPVAQIFFLVNAKGTAQKGIYLKALGAMEIPIPPLSEQTRIAQKLNELLAQVDTLKARIYAIPVLLKRFRQSILAAAVSGRLTEEWRNGNRPDPISTLLERIAQERHDMKAQKRLKASFGNYKKADGLYPLPCESWDWVCFDQISKNDNNALKAGPFGSALKKSDCVSVGYKVYGQEHVISSNEALTTYFIDESKFKELAACRIEAGDILISLVGTIGKVLILSEKAEAGIINPRLVKISLAPEICREYVRLYLDGSVAHGFFKRFSHGGTMEILNLGILKELPIPLPPLAEQTEIVRRVEQLFAFADQLEAKVASAKTRIDYLTQSILAKAFRGELVPQDPNDEPANVLLERIKAQRASAPKAKRGSKASA